MKFIKQDGLIFLIAILLTTLIVVEKVHAQGEWHVQTVQADSNVGTYTSIAIDSIDRPHMAYVDLNNGALTYAYFDGAQWEIEAIDNTSDTTETQSTSIAIDSSDHIHISYTTVSDNDVDLKYAYFDGSDWSIQGIDLDGNVGYETSMTLDSMGYPHISYIGNIGASEGIKYATFDGHAWNIETVDIGNIVDFGTSIALDSYSRPHITYSTYSIENDLKHAYKDGNNWVIETVDSGGAFSSIAFDSNDRPHISYAETRSGYSGGHLKHAYYDGSNWNKELVDTSRPMFGIGGYSSIAINSSDIVQISYTKFYQYNPAPQFAYFDGSTWQIEEPESTYYYNGQYASLALDSSGNPHMSYFNQFSRSVRYAYRTGPFVTEPDISVVPVSYDFGGVIEGTSLSTSVTVSNTGTADLLITDVGISGSSDFSFVNDCDTVLPQSSCTIAITFTPSTADPKSATLTISSNDTVDPQINVNLSGTGLPINLIPDIELSTTSIDFEGIPVGESASLELLVLNNGDADLTIAGTSISGSSDFSLTNPCTVISPAGSCTMTVTFNPSSSGIIEAALTIQSNDPDEPSVVISLQGNGLVAPEPNISVLPRTLSFGTVLIGVSSDQEVTVSNIGTGNLTLNDIQITSGASVFSRVHDCPETLEPGTSCNITVTFTPTSSGSETGTLTVISNDPDETAVEVTLIGDGIAAPEPDIYVPSQVVNFGTCLVGLSSNRNIDVSNVGTLDLTIDSISITEGSGDYSQSHNCPATLAPGGSCTVTVTFTPTSIGYIQGRINILSNDPDESPLAILLSGSGISPEIYVMPTIIDFGAVLIDQSLDRTVAVSNEGLADLTIGSISITAGSDGYIQSHDCPATLAPGGSCAVTVTFSPTSIGSISGTLTLLSNDIDESNVEVSLTGDGVAPEIDITPTILDFGSVPIGSQIQRALTVYNTGTALLNIVNVTTSGSYDFDYFNYCTSDIAPGNNCTISVTFRPLSEGSIAGVLHIESNDPFNPEKTVSLTGYGTSDVTADIWHIETIDTPGSVGWFPSIALNSLGYPHISYTNKTEDKVMHAAYDGSAWQIQTIESLYVVNVKGQTTSIAVDTTDFAHVSYFRTPAAGLNYGHYDGSWHIESIDLSGVSGMFSSIALDSSGYPHISYINETGNELKYAYFDGTLWHLETVDSVLGNFMSTSLALDQINRPNISYSDWGSLELKYARYDGDVWRIETIDSGGAYRTAMDIDVSGKPHIAYSSGTYSLKYAFFDGSNWILETVEEGYGGLISIALDFLDRPHVSYHGGSHLCANGVLKYAYHDGASWNTETVDSSSSCGYHSSIAFSSFGGPCISYLDQTNADLKYAYRSEITISDSERLDTEDGDINISVSTGNFISSPIIVPPASAIPDGFQTPYGGISFSIATSPGEKVMISLEFPIQLTPGTLLFKCQNGTCSEIPDVSISGNRVIYEVTEGGDLDEDGIQNGVLVEPCILGVPEVTPHVKVLIDIKPGSFPNCINKKSKGKIAVGILGSWVDAREIDTNTIKITKAPESDEGVFPIKDSLKDIDKDGLIDCVVHFSTRALASAGLIADNQTLFITARLVDGTRLRGSDIINLAGGSGCMD